MTCRLSIIAVTHAVVKGKKFYCSKGKAFGHAVKEDS
jgi:hypothetical protein